VKLRARTPLVLILVVWITGCGDSDGASSTTGALQESQAPPAGYSVNEAVAVCSNGSPGEREDLGDYCDGIVPHPDRLVTVSGSDGETLVCADGKPLMVKGTASPPRSLEGGGVPRCGPTGGGPQGKAVWVPYSVGRGITEAPEQYVKQQAAG